MAPRILALCAPWFLGTLSGSQLRLAFRSYMAIYSLANRTTNVTTANATLEIRTAAADACALMEIGIFLAAATASNFGLGRPAARGITPTSPVTVIAEDGNAPAGSVQTALA